MLARDAWPLARTWQRMTRHGGVVCAGPPIRSGDEAAVTSSFWQCVSGSPCRGGRHPSVARRTRRLEDCNVYLVAGRTGALPSAVNGWQQAVLQCDKYWYARVSAAWSLAECQCVEAGHCRKIDTFGAASPPPQSMHAPREPSCTATGGRLSGDAEQAATTRGGAARRPRQAGVNTRRRPPGGHRASVWAHGGVRCLETARRRAVPSKALTVEIFPAYVLNRVTVRSAGKTTIDCAAARRIIYGNSGGPSGPAGTRTPHDLDVCH